MIAIQADLKVRLVLSEEVEGATWDDLATRRAESRERHVEGLMLKRWSSPYRPGLKRGDWWKWKIDPFTMDDVHTTQRFGPVSAVEPLHVFELGFERIAPSTRHESGVAVRFPRILRWRRDKTPREADTLDALRRMMPVVE